MHVFSVSTTKIGMKMLSARKIQPVSLVSGNIKFVQIFAGVPWTAGVKRHWETDKLRIARFCVLFARVSCLEWNSLLSVLVLSMSMSLIRGEKPGRLLKVIRFSHFDKYHCALLLLISNAKIFADK